MKNAIFALFVALTFKAQADILTVAPEILWHCPGVFDAIDESDCPAPSADQLVPIRVASLSPAANDYTTRINQCQADSVILKLKTNVSLPRGDYEVDYNRYSELHRVDFNMSSSNSLSLSKKSLIETLSQLEKEAGSNQVEYLDCNSVADVNSARK